VGNLNYFLKILQGFRNLEGLKSSELQILKKEIIFILAQIETASFSAVRLLRSSQ
jgi:hypothetical protein